jgi:hypothetical protein
VLSSRERESLLCLDMIEAMKHAGMIDRAAWLQKFSWVGIEQPAAQVFPDGKYGPLATVGGEKSTANIRFVPPIPEKLWELPFEDALTVASVAVVVEGVVPDVYQGRKPQEVIQRQLAVAEALAARKEALMDEALP